MKHTLVVFVSLLLFAFLLSPAIFVHAYQFNSPMKRGSYGDNVRELQKFLGFKGAEIDSNFGPKTEAAVKSYQASVGLTADGIVGSATLDKINQSATKDPSGSVNGLMAFLAKLGLVPSNSLPNGSTNSVNQVSNPNSTKSDKYTDKFCSFFATASFPSNTDWNAFSLGIVRRSKLHDFKPLDANRYFPNGTVTDQGWVNIIAGIAKLESDFNTNDVYRERSGNYSVGLLSMSTGDDVSVSRGYKTKDLKDPHKNLLAGIDKFARLVTQQGVITSKDKSGQWVGASAYWSTLRDFCKNGRA